MFRHDCYGIGLCKELGVEVPSAHINEGTVVLNLTKPNGSFMLQIVCEACANACVQTAFEQGWNVLVERLADNPPKDHAWQYTCEEWENLRSGIKYCYDDDALGASPYHSNYHYCAVLSALKSGEEVPEEVINSFSDWTKNHIKSLMAEWKK